MVEADVVICLSSTIIFDTPSHTKGVVNVCIFKPATGVKEDAVNTVCIDEVKNVPVSAVVVVEPIRISILVLVPVVVVQLNPSPVMEPAVNPALVRSNAL